MGITKPKDPFNTRSAAKKYDAAEIAKIMDDLYRVGPQKPMGYLPLDTIRDICHRSVKRLQGELEARGLKTLLFDDPALCKGGALYAWHEETLTKKLESGRDILATVGLTTDCEDYVRKIDRYGYYIHPVYGFIAETFGQPFRMPVPGSESESDYPGAQQSKAPVFKGNMP